MKEQLSPTGSHYHTSIFSLFSSIERKVPGVALIWPTRLSWTSILSILFLVPEYPEQGIQPMFVSPSMKAAPWSERKRNRKSLSQTRPDQTTTRFSGSQLQQKQLRKQPLFFLSLCLLLSCVCVLCSIFFCFYIWLVF